MSFGCYDRDGNLVPDDWYNSAIWGRKYLDAYNMQKRVGRTQITIDIDVSTVWLTNDHGYGDMHLLFETMVFGGVHDTEMCRYTTEEEAMRGHLAVVDNLRQGREPFAHLDEVAS